MAGGVDHSWRGYNAVNVNQFGLSESNAVPWHHENSQSLLALQNTADSVVPSPNGDDEYNINIEWSTEENAFDLPVVESADRYEVSLRSASTDQTISVTPRNTSVFRPAGGQVCTWSVTRSSDGQLTGNGNITVDASALVTATGVPVATGQGSRLTILCP